MTAYWTSLGCGQNRTFEDIFLGPRRHWSTFPTLYRPNNESINWENNEWTLKNEKFTHLVHAVNTLSYTLWSCVPDAMQTTCCSVNNISVLSHHGTFAELTPMYERQKRITLTDWGTEQCSWFEVCCAFFLWVSPRLPVSSQWLIHEWISRREIIIFCNGHSCSCCTGSCCIACEDSRGGCGSWTLWWKPSLVPIVSDHNTGCGGL